MATRFYKTRDGDVLARIRDNGAAIPEVFDPRTRAWHEYPELDTWHDAAPINAVDALKLGATREDLAT